MKWIIFLLLLASCSKEPLQDCDCGVLIDTYEFIDPINWRGWIWQSDCGDTVNTFYWKTSDDWYIGKRICKLKEI